jgi:hypothetical protein
MRNDWCGVGLLVCSIACGSSAGNGAAPTTGSGTSTGSTTPTASTDARADCVALDSTTLDVRALAARRVLEARALAVEGGTEQQMEAAAAYCDHEYALRPHWYRPPSAEVAADLPLLVGGMFSPDHLGPAAYDERRARVEASPEAYLEALDVMLANGTPAELSNWWPSVVYEITRTRAHDATLDAVGRAAAFYRAASIGLPITTDEERATAQRIDQRGAVLGAMLAELDACTMDEPAVREGTVLDLPWSYQHDGAQYRLRIGEQTIPLARDAQGCFTTERLYGAWNDPARIADSLIRFDPDIHAAVSGSPPR